jgi:hypothetical protein
MKELEDHIRWKAVLFQPRREYNPVESVPLDLSTFFKSIWSLPDQTFIGMLYEGMLGRKVDSSSFLQTMETLQTGTPRSRVVAAIFASDEAVIRCLDSKILPFTRRLDAIAFAADISKWSAYSREKTFETLEWIEKGSTLTKGSRRWHLIRYKLLGKRRFFSRCQARFQANEKQ